jgi:hypothetical protein
MRGGEVTNMAIKLSIRADELPNLLDRAPAGVRYLSLDCFDTLLWRNCLAPRDVFADLPDRRRGNVAPCQGRGAGAAACAFRDPQGRDRDRGDLPQPDAACR